MLLSALSRATADEGPSLETSTFCLYFSGSCIPINVDVELYLTMHKSFVSSSLNIINRGCTFHLNYPYWTVTSLYENTMSSITVTAHKLTKKTQTKTSINDFCLVASRPPCLDRLCTDRVYINCVNLLSVTGTKREAILFLSGGEGCKDIRS